MPSLPLREDLKAIIVLCPPLDSFYNNNFYFSLPQTVDFTVTKVIFKHDIFTFTPVLKVFTAWRPVWRSRQLTGTNDAPNDGSDGISDVTSPLTTSDDMMFITEVGADERLQSLSHNTTLHLLLSDTADETESDFKGNKRRFKGRFVLKHV